MVGGSKEKKPPETIIIFSPFVQKTLIDVCLYGDLTIADGDVKVFFITHLSDANVSTGSTKENINKDERRMDLKDWIHVRFINNTFYLREICLRSCRRKCYFEYILWVNYDHKLLDCEVSSSEVFGAYTNKSYLKHIRDKFDEEMVGLQTSRLRQNEIKYAFTECLSSVVFKLADWSIKLLTVTKYFNIALHINNYLHGFVWAIETAREKKKLDVKVINLLLSILVDMLLGILFLNWLNSKISLDSSPTIFLLTTESVVNSIKDLLNWLRGDPAGLKLNWAFNNVLATFFSFHIDIWWTFITFLKPLVKIIFQIFLKLGLLGITFQASITADLLALVSFHVYCIYAYAAKLLSDMILICQKNIRNSQNSRLYSIQISVLISLWRLFLGRKKNPLREKVDSCKYSSAQLFIGTLGFTILLFLLPTTLLYYIVFTCIRLSILAMGGVLELIRYFNQTLPVYSTILWLIGSSKVSVSVKMEPEEHIKSDFLIVNMKPVRYTWWETVLYFTPDCVKKPLWFKLSDVLSSLIRGNLIYPL